MLHPRRRSFWRPLTGPASLLARLTDRVVDSDPGLLRLFLACRGTAGLVLMILCAIGLGELLRTSQLFFAAGAVCSLMAPFWMREPNRAERQRTLLWQALAAAGSVVVTTVLHGDHRLGDGAFLILVFLTLLLQGRSPRAMGIGVGAIIEFYVGLYLQLPPEALPYQLLSIALAVPVTWFCCFVLVPLRPAATLRRAVQAVQGRAAAVLRAATLLQEDGPAASRSLVRSLSRLTEVALAADDQLALLYPVRSIPLRFHLMDLELATARLAVGPLDAAALGGIAEGQRRLARLQVHEQRLRQGRWRARHMRSEPPAYPSAVGGVFADIARAAAALGAAAAVLPVADKPRPVPPSPPGPLGWRVALRVTLASAIAMAGGMAISPQRWFWAVITTYVVFLGTRSRSETVYKGVQRLCGTLLGLVAGVSLASVLQGSGPAQAVALVAAVFGMYYFFFLSYTAGIFCVTVLLGLLYSLLGSSTEPILLLRLEETAIGASAAIFVAVCILPLRTQDRVAQSGTAVLRALADSVGVCRRALAGETDALPVPALRAVDRQVADLRLALIPLTAGRFMLRRFEHERPVPALLTCVHWARALAVAATKPDPQAARRAGTIERSLRTLAEGGQLSPLGHPAKPAPGSNPVAVALDELDLALSALVERLAIGALHGFQLEA